MKSLSCVHLLATPQTIACQAPPSMRFFRKEYRSGLPCRQILYCMSHQGIPLQGKIVSISIFDGRNWGTEKLSGLSKLIPSGDSHVSLFQISPFPLYPKYKDLVIFGPLSLVRKSRSFGGRKFHSGPGFVT